MCGIAGYLSGRPKSYERRLEEALDLMEHRGPDDRGSSTFVSRSGVLGFGSTRLAIVDLSPAGHMPMHSPDGRFSIVFNGEVYNLAELRVDLRSRGFTFRSRSDTEVLLHGLALEGSSFLDRVDGMYALAFWDNAAGSLTLARDRFGEKPLFVSETSNGDLLFASELPALIKLRGDAPAVAPHVLRHIIEWGYPPPTQSIFTGVRKLPPGCWERHGMDDVERDSLEPLHSNVRIDDVRELEDAADLFVETFRESVRKRLIADVPVGIFLSGGLDSAAITAFAAELAGPRQRINTYTVGYPGAKVSELANARRVVERFNTHHREIVLSESHLEALPFVAAAMGEPVGDSAALPTYFLSLAAKQTSTVVLTGEGSDELFFGYPRYLMHDIADDVGEGSLRSRLVASLPFAPFTRLRHVLPEPWNRDRLWKGLRPDAFGIPVDPPSDPAEPNAAADPSTAADWSRADDITRWLPEAVLTRIDRMTMAASIEARAPFLAREVARLGLHLRPSFLRRFPYGKMVVRRALQPYLGIRKSLGIKRAFAVPLVQWLNGPLRATTRDVFFGPRLSDRGWFDAAALRAIGEAILRNDESASRLGWTVIAIELWARAHVDRQAPSEERPLTFDVGAG